MDQGNPSTSSAHRPTKWNYLLPSGKKKVQGAKKKSVTRDNTYTHIGERITFFPFFYFKFRIIYSRLENKKRNSVYYHSRVNGIIRYACNGQQLGRPVGRNKKKTNNNRKIRDAGWWWRRFPSGYPLLLRERNQTEKKGKKQKQVDRKHTQISSGRIQLCRSRAAFSSFSCVGERKKKKNHRLPGHSRS